MGRFQKRSFFCENETIVFENDRLTKQKTIVKRSFSKTINNPTCKTEVWPGNKQPLASDY